MCKGIFALLAVISMTVIGACGRQPLETLPGAGGQGGQSGHTGHFGTGGTIGIGTGGTTGTGGIPGTGGITGSGGSTSIFQLPDGGLPALLGDSGLIGGIMDAPRDSLIGQLFCGSEARLGAPCSVDGQMCVLPRMGGACLCVGGTYLCPLDPSSGPTACPPNAVTGAPCYSPLAVCIGGGANACICRGLDYLCI
jgi:hypothetical protein